MLWHAHSRRGGSEGSQRQRKRDVDSKNRPDLAPQCAKLCWTEFEVAYRDMGFPSVQSALDNLNESYMNDDRVPLVQ